MCTNFESIYDLPIPISQAEIIYLFSGIKFYPVP